MFVIQFPEEKYCDLDWIAAIEDKLDVCLVDAAVDGHDYGSGEVNIFIHTNNPIATLESVKEILKGNESALEDVKIAYRELRSDHFICLWPNGLNKFLVK